MLRDDAAGFEVVQRPGGFALRDTRTHEDVGGPWDRLRAIDEFERARAEVRRDEGLPRDLFLEGRHGDVGWASRARPGTPAQKKAERQRRFQERQRLSEESVAAKERRVCRARKTRPPAPTTTTIIVRRRAR